MPLLPKKPCPAPHSHELLQPQEQQGKTKITTEHKAVHISKMQNPWKINASTRLAVLIWANPRGDQVSHWERGAGHNPRTTKDSIFPMDQVLLQGEAPIYAKEIYKPTKLFHPNTTKIIFKNFFLFKENLKLTHHKTIHSWMWLYRAIR